MSDYRYGFRQCRQIERAARRTTFKRLLVVVAVLVACVAATLALWQWFPRTAFGSTRTDTSLFMPDISRGVSVQMVDGVPVVTPTPQGD